MKMPATPTSARCHCARVHHAFELSGRNSGDLEVIQRIRQPDPPKARIMASTKTSGFSLLELMITLSIALILAAVTFIGLRPMLNQSPCRLGLCHHVNGLAQYQNLAITQSHEYYVKLQIR